MQTLDQATPLSVDSTQPRAERIELALPLNYGCSRTVTQNISATGVFFETDETESAGSAINFSVEVLIDGQKFNLVCEGEVVRVDRREGKAGIAARLTSSFLEVS